MKIARRYRVLTFGTFVFCIFVPVAYLALFALAVVRNDHLPLPAWITFTATGLGFVGIALRILLLRKAHADAVSFTTSQGVDVLTGSQAPAAEAVAQILDSEFMRAIAFWVQRYPSHGDALRRVFDGASLEFSTEVLVAHGAHGERRFALGLAAGRAMAVMWKVGEPLERLRALVRHEAGHVALWAIHPNIAEDAAHTLMTTERYEHG